LSNSVRQAREALGYRLRDLRKDAQLSGRQLATLANWHYTKVSKIEHGTTMPSDADLEAWCRFCGAVDELPDLKATVRNIERAYVELKRLHRGGRAHFQRKILEDEAGTRLFRCFQIFVVPGLIQTPEYARVMLTEGARHLETPPDIERTVALRMERQRILYTGDHLFHFVLCEPVLTSGIAPPEVMLGQLDRLMTISSLPRIRIGIIPRGARYPYPPTSAFWIYDEREVQTETFSAQISITRPQEIALYAKVFGVYDDIAVYGAEAKALISQAMKEIGKRAEQHGETL
jgi:transcriptional regulator with XRE-family HTH domain